MTEEKISNRHLERVACVYIRQSTMQQVRNNLESHRRQYALRERAIQLGFGTVRVIDDDLGVTGSGQRERPGFGRLLSLVCDGRVGAVFALEASRLARNNRDWHHLIDLCVLTETLVIDADGVYDPRLLNDRLLLGLKGTMSEFELGVLRQRAQEAYRQKVLRGEVLTRVPVGYVRDGSTGISTTPDREVREAIAGAFDLLARLGSVRQVHLWYHHEKVLFPSQRNRDGAGALEWRLPDYQQLLRLVKSPVYAGAFAYGRTRSRSGAVDGRARKTGGHVVPMDEWQVLIKDHHVGYITWERYMENQRMTASNHTKSHAVAAGAARSGPALLAGLLRCARCGQKLHVKYRGADGRAPRYVCEAGKRARQRSFCIAFGGIRADHAVAEAAIEACQPMAIEASMRVQEECAGEFGQKRRSLELAVERLRYETERARRQYDAVDPENRLVAAELEQRWNASLAQLAEAEERLETESPSEPGLTPDQRRRLAELGSDLKVAWADPAAPIELKKRILRSVIKEIMVDVDHDGGRIEMRIHWKGGAHTMLRIRKNRPGRNGSATDANVVEMVRVYAQAWSDGYIAGLLNRLGCSTGPGNSWNETRVKNLRLYNNIPVFSKAGPRSWVTMSEAAEQLQVGVCAIRTMIKHGLLPATQLKKGAPWTIGSEGLALDQVVAYARNARTGGKAPRDHKTQTLIPYI